MSEGLNRAFYKWRSPHRILRLGQGLFRESVAFAAAMVFLKEVYFPHIHFIYSRYKEKRADLQGISYCCKEDQRKFIQYFQKQHQIDSASSEWLDLNLQIQYLEDNLSKTLSKSEKDSSAIESLEQELTQLRSRKTEIEDSFPGMEFSLAGEDKEHPPTLERIAYLRDFFIKMHGEEP